VTPVRIQKHILNQDGNITLIVPKFKKEALQKFIIPKNKSGNFKIRLDGLGSATWLEIDGKRNVHEICKLLKEKLGEKIEPIEEVETRITKFLTQLYDRRYISFKELQEQS